MSNKFGVDWFDPENPEVVLADTSSDRPPVSLTAAKLEVYERANAEIKHWRAVLKRTKELKGAEVEASRSVFKVGDPVEGRDAYGALWCGKVISNVRYDFVDVAVDDGDNVLLRRETVRRVKENVHALPVIPFDFAREGP